MIANMRKMKICFIFKKFNNFDDLSIAKSSPIKMNNKSSCFCRIDIEKISATLEKSLKDYDCFSIKTVSEVIDKPRGYVVSVLRKNNLHPKGVVDPVLTREMLSVVADNYVLETRRIFEEVIKRGASYKEKPSNFLSFGCEFKKEEYKDIAFASEWNQIDEELVRSTIINEVESKSANLLTKASIILEEQKSTNDLESDDLDSLFSTLSTEKEALDYLLFEGCFLRYCEFVKYRQLEEKHQALYNTLKVFHSHSAREESKSFTPRHGLSSSAVLHRLVSPCHYRIFTSSDDDDDANSVYTSLEIVPIFNCSYELESYTFSRGGLTQATYENNI